MGFVPHAGVETGVGGHVELAGVGVVGVEVSGAEDLLFFFVREGAKEV